VAANLAAPPDPDKRFPVVASFSIAFSNPVLMPPAPSGFFFDPLRSRFRWLAAWRVFAAGRTAGWGGDPTSHRPIGKEAVSPP